MILMIKPHEVVYGNFLFVLYVASYHCFVYSLVGVKR